MGFRVILVLFYLVDILSSVILCLVDEEGLAVLLCCSILKQSLWKFLILPHRWTFKSNLKIAEESGSTDYLHFDLKNWGKRKRGEQNKIPGYTFKKCHFWDFSLTCICFSCTYFELAWITLTFLFTFPFNIFLWFNIFPPIYKLNAKW